MFFKMDDTHSSISRTECGKKQPFSHNFIVLEPMFTLMHRMSLKRSYFVRNATSCVPEELTATGKSNRHTALFNLNETHVVRIPLLVCQKNSRQRENEIKNTAHSTAQTNSLFSFGSISTIDCIFAMH